MSTVRTMTLAAWRELGEKLYGSDERAWKFRCPKCGHVQSGRSVREHAPRLEGAVSSWIYLSCEGRVVPGHGCDWTLGGLFQIHRLVVVEENPRRERRVFEFADDPAARA